MKLGNVIPVLRGYVPCRKYDVLDDIDCENKKKPSQFIVKLPFKTSSQTKTQSKKTVGSGNMKSPSAKFMSSERHRYEVSYYNDRIRAISSFQLSSPGCINMCNGQRLPCKPTNEN